MSAALRVRSANKIRSVFSITASVSQLGPDVIRDASFLGPPVHDVVVPGEARFGMTFENATAVAGTEMYRDDPRLKRYGLTDTPLAYAPAVTPESPLEF